MAEPKKKQNRNDELNEDIKKVMTEIFDTIHDSKKYTVGIFNFETSQIKLAFSEKANAETMKLDIITMLFLDLMENNFGTFKSFIEKHSPQSKDLLDRIPKANLDVKLQIFDVLASIVKGHILSNLQNGTTVETQDN